MIWRYPDFSTTASPSAGWIDLLFQKRKKYEPWRPSQENAKPNVRLPINLRPTQKIVFLSAAFVQQFDFHPVVIKIQWGRLIQTVFEKSRHWDFNFLTLSELIGYKSLFCFASIKYLLKFFQIL